MNIVFSRDVILCGWLISKYQRTNFVVVVVCVCVFLEVVLVVSQLFLMVGHEIESEVVLFIAHSSGL